MGLFDKKYCDICGEKIGLFGNRKLEDGNICKDCAKLLSPWFTQRRHATLEEIRQQLAYREANRDAVAQFSCSYEVGEDMMLLLDEAAGTFMVTKYTDPGDWEEENPDVFSLEDVREVNLDIQEDSRELTREDEEGNEVSYSPPRYEYSYRFNIQILLDHPFVDEIRYQLNEYPLEIEYCDRSIFGLGTLDPTRDSEYRHYSDMADEILSLLTEPAEEEYGEEYDEEYEDESSEEEEEEIEVVTCPYCGSRTKVTYTGRCEHCGGNLDD